jgi:hypothetical protein
VSRFIEFEIRKLAKEINYNTEAAELTLYALFRLLNENRDDNENGVPGAHLELQSHIRDVAARLLDDARTRDYIVNTEMTGLKTQINAVFKEIAQNLYQLNATSWVNTPRVDAMTDLFTYSTVLKVETSRNVVNINTSSNPYTLVARSAYVADLRHGQQAVPVKTLVNQGDFAYEPRLWNDYVMNMHGGENSTGIDKAVGSVKFNWADGGHTAQMELRSGPFPHPVDGDWSNTLLSQSAILKYGVIHEESSLASDNVEFDIVYRSNYNDAITTSAVPTINSSTITFTNGSTNVGYTSLVAGPLVLNHPADYSINVGAYPIKATSNANGTTASWVVRFSVSRSKMPKGLVRIGFTDGDLGFTFWDQAISDRGFALVCDMSVAIDFSMAYDALTPPAAYKYNVADFNLDVADLSEKVSDLTGRVALESAEIDALTEHGSDAWSTISEFGSDVQLVGMALSWVPGLSALVAVGAAMSTVGEVGRAIQNHSAGEWATAAAIAAGVLFSKTAVRQGEDTVKLEKMKRKAQLVSTARKADILDRAKNHLGYTNLSFADLDNRVWTVYEQPSRSYVPGSDVLFRNQGHLSKFLKDTALGKKLGKYLLAANKYPAHAKNVMTTTAIEEGNVYRYIMVHGVSEGLPYRPAAESRRFVSDGTIPNGSNEVPARPKPHFAGEGVGSRLAIFRDRWNDVTASWENDSWTPNWVTNQPTYELRARAIYADVIDDSEVDEDGKFRYARTDKRISYDGEALHDHIGAMAYFRTAGLLENGYSMFRSNCNVNATDFYNHMVGISEPSWFDEIARDHQARMGLEMFYAHNPSEIPAGVTADDAEALAADERAVEEAWRAIANVANSGADGVNLDWV